MSKQATSGALSGAAQGAMVGSVVPGIGTAIGAVVGGVAGFISGGLMGDAATAKRKATNLSNKIAKRQAAISRRDMLNDFRQKRAMQVSAGFAESGSIFSSTLQSAISSFGSQVTTNLNIFDDMAAKQNKITKLIGKAGSAVETAGLISTATNSLMSLGGSAYGAFSANKLSGDQLMSQMAGTNQSVSSPAANMTQYSGPR